MKTINDLIWDPNLDPKDGNSENPDRPVEITPFVALPICSACSTGGCGIAGGGNFIIWC